MPMKGRLSSLARRAIARFRPRRSERDMEEEMRAHIALEADWIEQHGVPRDEAMRQALASFGGVARYREEARDAWPLRWAERVWSDTRFALRSLHRSPSFTTAAVLALALGMAASNVVFRTVDSVAFRPLAVRDPEGLVALYATRGEARLLGFSYPTYEYVRQHSRALSDLAAATEGPVAVFQSGERTAVWSTHVSDNYFTMLGVLPTVGRLFEPGDLRTASVVLSHAFWVARYGASPAAIGQTLVVNGTPFSIIGVAPPQFTGTRLFTYNPDLWFPVGRHDATIPASANLLADRGAARFLLIGRRSAGVSIARVREDVNALMGALAESFPETYRSVGVDVFSNRTPINPWLAPRERIAWIGALVLAGISLVLIVACTNVATLLLARGAARRREIATRLALGAAMSRVVQQLLTESMVLAALGALAAVPLARMGSRIVLALTPPLEFASVWRPADAPRATAYAAAVTIAAALLFGLMPALQTARVDVRAGLHTGLPVAIGRRRRIHLRELLLVAQVALSVTMLAAAGLFVRSLRHARVIDPGFAPAGAVVFTLDPLVMPTYDSARTRELYRRVNARLLELPGVQVVSRAMSIPLDGNSAARHVFTGVGSETVERAPAAEFNLVGPGYFRAIGTPILSGREFVSADGAADRYVAIVNDALARRLWPGQSALGKTIRLQSPTAPPLTVVGVARVSNYRSVGERARPAVWRSVDRGAATRSTIIVRGTGGEAAMAREIRRVMTEIEPSLPLIGLSPLRDRVELSYSPMVSGAFAASTFAVLAMLLAASGLFGLVAYGVSQRSREIGIRVALGARSVGVMWFVVRRSMFITAAGIVVGLSMIALVPMGLGRLLYGVTPYDPPTLAATAGVFLVVAAVAALLPARRATRLDPVCALRVDN